MGEMTLLDEIRGWIGDIAFRIFLWSVRMDSDSYLEAVQREGELIREQQLSGKEPHAKSS